MIDDAYCYVSFFNNKFINYTFKKYIDVSLKTYKTVLHFLWLFNYIKFNDDAYCYFFIIYNN